MNGYQWNDARDNYLQQNWSHKRVVDIAGELGVSKYVILRRARKLGIDKKPEGGPRPQYYQWTEQMDRYLRENYLTHSNEELAAYLSVSHQAVMRRMKKHGLSRGNHGNTHFKWDEVSLNQLTSLYGKEESAASIAKAIGISVLAVKRKLKTLGLRRPVKPKEKAGDSGFIHSSLSWL